MTGREKRVYHNR